MPRITSVKRYAQAVFELALARDEFDGWQDALERIACLSRQEELVALLENPRVPFDTKKELLQNILGAIHPLALNLTLLLVIKGRLGLAGEIFRQYLTLLDAHRGVERAKVVAAVSLNDDERNLISSHLEKIVQRKVLVDAKVDSSIIGGFIARIGDRLIDGSIRQNLESLKKRMVEAGR